MLDPVFLGLAALVGLSHAAPAEPASIEARNRPGFSIAQVNTGNKKLLAGPVAMRSTFLKFNKPVPANVEAAAVAATQKGTVAATPESYDSSYLCPGMPHHMTYTCTYVYTGIP